MDIDFGNLGLSLRSKNILYHIPIGHFGFDAGHTKGLVKVFRLFQNLLGLCQAWGGHQGIKVKLKAFFFSGSAML
jgi:hypothetical protein